MAHKSATRKSATRKPVTGKSPTRKPLAKKSATRKPAAKKSATVRPRVPPTRSAASRRKRAAAPPKVAAGRRARNKEDKQRRIVTVALSLFQSKGFYATTTKEIARRANIAEGTLFNYFRTKDDIALHFFELEVDHAIAAVQENSRLRKAPLEEKLFTLIHTQLEYLAPYENFIGTAIIESLKPSSSLGVFSHRAMALRHRYIGFVQELIEQSLPPKSARPVAWLMPDAFWIFYVVVLLFWLHDESPRKQNTLAFLDRTLKFGVAMLERAG